MPLNVMLSIIYLSLLPRHSLPSLSAPSSTHNILLSLQRANKIDAILLGFVKIPFAIFVHSTPLLSAHPSFYFASQLFPQP